MSLAFVDHANRSAGQALDRRTAVARAAVVSEVRRYEDAVRAMAGAVGGYDALTQTQFTAVTEATETAQLAGATGVSYVVAVTDDQVDTAQQTWRSRGAAGLEFDPLDHAEHLFAVFGRPLDHSAGPVIGADLSQTPEAAAALAEARRSDRLTVSDTFHLPRDQALPPGQQQLSFLLAAPVHGPPIPDGAAPFRGWITMGLHGQDFVGGTMSILSKGQVGAALWATNASGRQVRVAELPSGSQPDRYREETIAVAQRVWTLRTSAAVRTLPGGSLVAARTTGGSGLLLSVLFAGLVWLLATGKARAETQVVSATAELCEQATLLASIIEAMADGVTVTDEAGNFLIRNRAAMSISGVSPAEVGVDDADGNRSLVVAPGDWQQYFGIYRPDGATEFPTDQLPGVRALAGEATDNVEVLIRNAVRPNGVLIRMHGRPLEFADGRRRALLITQDITAARAQEAELVGFAGMVAHDLKSPLNAVSGFAEILADQVARDAVDPQTLRLAVSRIHSGVRGMVDLINDLLRYATARDAPLRPQIVDLRAIVDDVIAQRTDHLAVANVDRPEVRIGRLPRVVADPGMVHQLMDNLIGNAFTYVEPGRRARVDVTAAAAHLGWVQIEVADRGPGIPDGEKARVLEPFHRVPGAGTGSGLGLAICRRIVERHGGVIAITDNPGGGTRLRFTLPTVDPDGAPPDR